MNLRSTLLFLGLMATLPPLAARTDESVSTPADIFTIVDGSNRFAIDLFRRLRDRPGNIVFSPYSISTALAMTYAGARGQTATEMAAVLHFPFAGGRLHPGYRELQAGVNERAAADSVELAVANRLWGRKKYALLPLFLDTTRTDYGAELGVVDFRRDPEGARAEINAWVAGKTRDRIAELLPSDFLNSDLTVLVLTDAIYFNGRWAAEFVAKATTPEPFHVSMRGTISVPMMMQTGRFPYRHQKGVGALRLDYRGGRFSMVFLLPDRVDGVASLENDLSTDRIQEWLSGLTTESLEVRIPRFRFTSGFRLRDTLRRMGMRRAFSESANLTGMAPDSLLIGPVVHQTAVSVGERGTEAAAATAVEVHERGGIGYFLQPHAFTADHPFLFLIRDNESGAILFLGRVTDPQDGR